MRQFFKGIDILWFIMEVKVLFLAPKIWEPVPDSAREIKAIFKIKLKSGPSISVHVNFTKII